jgi:hypothetical protein
MLRLLLLSHFPCALQATLEAAYRTELHEGYGVVFSSLLALNNLPIKRFADWLMVRRS